MRLDLQPPVVRVSLSRRNLLTLIAKMSQPGSYRTIVSGNVHGPDGALIPGCVVLVSAEDDAGHYAGREPAGLMHPATEEVVRWMVDELHVDGEGKA